MIYDCFTLRDELDLLELRLKILENKVDKFVISEANYTHKGELKPYNFEENKKRFSKWLDKIIYLPVDFEDDIKNNNIDFHNIDGPRDDVWILENSQRNAILYGLENCTDNDIIIIGDLDEIINPDIIPLKINTPVCFVQNMYFYYFNNKSIGPKDISWVGTVACNFGYLQHVTPQYLRDNRWSLSPIYNAGWHWSYFGGEEAVRYKVQCIVEAEYLMSDLQITMEEAIDNFRKLKDFYGRKDLNFQLINLENEYPLHIFNILKTYKHLIYDPKRKYSILNR
jgi:beta-1,4-mannosyl-glycoprotein beta-1,4-N-acetylglucosaminyltransferase